MADFLVGDVVARLRADVAQFDRAIQDAIQRLNQLTAAQSQVRQSQGQNQQSTQQSTAAYQALVQTVSQQTQAYASASGATNAYKQSQDAAKVATQAMSTAAGEQASAVGASTTAVTAAAGALRAVGTIAAGIGLATSLGALVSQLRELATATVQAGIRLDALRTSFVAVQGQVAGQLNLNALFATAQRLGVGFVDLATSFRSFSAATAGTALEGEKARRVFEQVTAGARAMGASTEQTGRALLGLQQIVSTGTVTMENLRGQVAEALPGAMGLAARAMGKTTEELNKLVAAGTDSIAFVERFGNQIQAEFGSKATSAVENAATAFQRLRNEAEQFAGALAASLLPALKAVADAATAVLKTWREAREAREQEAGGPLPQVPPDIAAMSPAIRARQTEIEQLRGDLRRSQLPDVGAMLGGPAGLGLPTPEQIDAIQAKLKTLMEEQRKAIALMQEQLAGEGQESVMGRVPGASTFDAVRKTLEAGRQTLAKMDVSGELFPSLDIAKEKVQAWSKTLDTVAAQLNQLGQPFLKQMAPQIDAMIKPANQLLEVLKADASLAGDAAQEVSDMRSRVAERERDAAQAAREAARQAAQAAREQEADDARNASTRMQALRELAAEEERGIEALRRLAAAYGPSKEARDLDTASMLEAQLATSQYATEARALADAIEAVARIEAQLPQLRREAAASARLFEESRERDAAQQDLDKKLAQITRPRDESLLDRSRREAAGRGLVLTEAQEANIRAVDRWQQGMRLAEQVGDAAAQTLTRGLLSIVDGTERVGEAFKLMAKSILDSIAEIVLHETFRKLIGFGIGLLGSAFAPSVTPVATESASSLGDSSSFIGGILGSQFETGFQHGGVVNRPTHAMLGENPGMNPEYIVNTPQMQALMASAMSAGDRGRGQAVGGDVVIINVNSPEQAQREAAQQRAMGNRVIINSIIDELSAGSGSRIRRALTAGGM